VKLDTRLVGDNNNKGIAPNLIIYRRLLLKTPTRAVHVTLHPTPTREAGTTIIEKTNNLQRTEAREVGET
jgi:hypothetical protein